MQDFPENTATADPGKIRITIPDKAEEILDVLHGAGYEAYVVGGCVRDSILGRIPNDWDITTSARPEEVKKLFRRSVDTGIQHGTVTVMLGREGFEVTTYRIDGEYLDARHPKEVTFTASLEEDLKRRDFTINAMAYNSQDGLVDYFDGLGDIRRKLIRAVGDPRERFREDALRIMRAVRFASQLGYGIEEETRKAVAGFAPELSLISSERINAELTKLLISPHPENLRTMYETGITKVVLPEFDACMETTQNNPHHIYSVGEHIIHAVSAVRPDRVLRYAMLFHDIGKPLCRETDEDGTDHFHGHAEISARMADGIMRRLKFDNETRENVTKLVKFHGMKFIRTPAGIRHAVHEVGEDLFPLLLEVKAADGLAQSPLRREEKEAELTEVRKIYGKILADKDPISLKSLAVNGGDLIKAGIKPGPEMGRILGAMLEDVLDFPEHNSREYLMEKYAGSPRS